MLKLIESRRPRTKSRGATLFSIVAHAMVIGAVVVRTAAGTPKPEVVDPDPGIIYLPQSPSAPTAPSSPMRRPVEAPTVPVPPTIPTTEIPTEIPDPGTPLAPPSEDPPGPTVPGELIGLPPGTGSTITPDSSAMWADQVDRRVVLKGKQRTPRYPDALRLDGREGSVVAFFVVDTLGRVEPESFRAVSTTHALFTGSVRAAVLDLRFTPAESGGRRVRQLVEQRFVFALRR